MNIIVFGDHNVPALKIAEHEILVFSMREIIAQRFKIINKFLFVVRLCQSIKKIVFEVKQVRHDRLFSKFSISEAFLIVEVLVSLNLQLSQCSQALSE